MNILVPVSKLMSTSLITVHPKDTLSKVKELFEEHKIHHIPVVEFKKIVGLLSKTDLLHFVKGATSNSESANLENSMRLSHYCVKDLMTKNLATLEPEDPIRTALEVFKENLFHALPIVKDGELVGILTTYDLLMYFGNEAIQLADYQSA